MTVVEPVNGNRQERLFKRLDLYAALIIVIIIIVGAVFLYHFSINPPDRFWKVLGIVLTGIGSSCVAALVVKFLLMDSLKNEAMIESKLDGLKSEYSADQIVEKLKRDFPLDRHVEIIERSLLGLSVDGVILDPKTNFDLALKMIDEALYAGKEIVEGNLTSDESFIGDGTRGNFNKALLNKIAEGGHSEDRLRRYIKIYKSYKIEENEGDPEELRKKQEDFEKARNDWNNLGIQVFKFDKLCIDFLLIKSNGNAEKALVGVFFDEHQKENDIGWLALYLTSGKTLEKLSKLAYYYETAARNEKDGLALS